jgi:hypothetical protein
VFIERLGENIYNGYMVFFKHKGVYILLAFLMLAGAVSSLAFLHFAVPVKPETPYFPESSSVIANTNIAIGEFRPVYLWAFRKNGGFFYKVAYRDGRGHIRVIDILAGGR